MLLRDNSLELYLKDKLMTWNIKTIDEIKHLLKSFLITYRNFIKNVGFHGNVNQNSIILTPLPQTEAESEKDDSPFKYGYRLNYSHLDVMEPLEWAQTKINRLKNNQRLHLR